MFELFLFINPLGLSCYHLEKQIRKIAEELDLEICINYIPLVTMTAMKQDLVKRNWNFNTSINLANYHLASLSVQKFYYAIQIAYGKKRARLFLFKLQEALSDGKTNYSEALAETLVQDLGLNLEKVKNSLTDACLREFISQDSTLASKFNVTSLPSTVVFNDESDDSGLLLDGDLSYDDLREIFTDPSASACLDVADNDAFYWSDCSSHLRLL